MPFYKKKIQYEDIAPLSQKFRAFLRTTAICTREYNLTSEDEATEIFLCDDVVCKQIFSQYHNIYSFLINSHFLATTPFDNTHLALYFYPAADGPRPTVTKTHVRLPKLSHLITLTPADFFSLLNIISTSKVTNAGDALTLNPGAAGISSIESTTLAQFFTRLRVNWRLNSDYADRKWTDRKDIVLMSEQYPSRESHLMVMQYFTATQNNDLLYFPMETAIDLELPTDEWHQISEDYCTPPGTANPTHIRKEF